MNRMSRASFDNVYADLFTFQQQPRRYQQARPRRITHQLVDWPLYVGQTKRWPWWHPHRSTWVQLAYVVVFVVVLVVVIRLVGGSLEVRLP